MSSFGIYFGNTTISIAVCKDGKTEVVTNDSGDRLTPAVVIYNQNEFTVGLAAKNSLTHNATGVVINNKCLMDDNLSDEYLEKIMKTIPCQSTVKDNGVVFHFNQGTRTLTSEDIATQLFKKMFSIATNINRSSHNIKVVVSVPTHFSQTSRQKVWSAAENAGFIVLQIINEPSAAVLAYELDQSESITENVLVYRLGGISCNASILKIHNGLCSILTTIHEADLGGNYFTKLLADYIAKEFMNRWKLDPQESKRSMNKLMRQAEFGKHVLSTKTSTSMFIESLCDGVDWEQNMTRPRFENIISPHLQKYIEPIHKALREANLSANQITKVIFCGGSTRIPKLQSAVVSLFPDAVVLDDKPDEIIAEGCARQASLLESPWDPDCTHLNMKVSLLSKDIYICNEKRQIKAHIPSMTPLPTKINFSECLDGEQYRFVVMEGSTDEDCILSDVTFSNDGLVKDFQANITTEKIVIEVC